MKTFQYRKTKLSIEYIDKIVMFIHRSNQGFWAIRNAGLRVMKGDFVVDGDYYIYLINSVVIAF